jgi:hypothetical protein
MRNLALAAAMLVAPPSSPRGLRPRSAAKETPPGRRAAKPDRPPGREARGHQHEHRRGRAAGRREAGRVDRPSAIPPR